VRLHISPWPRFWTQLRFPFELYRYKPDVLFMPIQQLPYLRPRQMKTVCVVHDLAWINFGEYFTAKDWVLQHTFTASVVRGADHLIAVSQATADDIARYYGRTAEVHVVHHGVDHTRFRPPVGEEENRTWEALKQWQPKLQKPYILHVGQIQPRKNLIRLIKAFESQPGDSQLVLAGSHGWLNKPIYERAQKSSVASRILMPGRVPDELLTALYWHADVFVMPSLYEGFGLPVLEAMACGTPTVTSAVSSLPEVAGKAAVLVDPMSVEAIAAGIYTARERRAELLSAGLQQAAKFTWDRTARRIASILSSL
jgi:glycosyltransferase involved in cell wall biosynthesis